MNSDSLADTQDLLLPTPPEPIPSPRQIEVRISGESHQGLVRANNEDCFLISRVERCLETVLTNVPPEYSWPRLHDVAHALLVADGVGGAAAGEVASRSAVQALANLVRATPDWIFASDDAQLEAVMARMAMRFQTIDQALINKAKEDVACAGMGTTLTLACSLGLRLVVCHIGDSRAYLFRGGALRQLTRDMTVAQDLVDTGRLDPAAKRAHPLGKVLTQCLGRGDVVAEAQCHDLHDQDRLLLCTDGLTEMLSDGEIAEVLGATQTPEAGCRQLVERALKAGGRDNVTVVVAHYGVV